MVGQRGKVTHGRVHLHERSFVGNVAVVKAGTTVADRALVALQSLAPARTISTPGSTWIGSPAVVVPRQDNVSAAVATQSTRQYTPPTHMIVGHYLIEVLGYCLLVFYQSVVITLALVALKVANFEFITLTNSSTSGMPAFIVILPCIRFGSVVVACLLTALTKWVVIGHYILYSTYV